MPCTRVQLPNGMSAIVCGSRTRAKKCACGSGRPTSLLCDWRMNGTAPAKTCDKAICPTCALEVGTNKHLCAQHQAAWRAHPLFRL